MLFASFQTVAAEKWSPADFSGKVAGDVLGMLQGTADAATDTYCAVALDKFRALKSDYEQEAPLLRSELYNALMKNKRVRTGSLEYMDGIIDTLFPNRTLDSLTPDQLVDLGKRTNTDYILSGRIVTVNGEPVLQLFVYNLHDGLLEQTPAYPMAGASAALKTAPAVVKPVETTPPAHTPDPPATAEEETVVAAAVDSPKPAIADKKTEEPPATESAALFASLTPGEIVFLSGAVPQSPLVDFLPLNLNKDAYTEIAFLNTDSMSVIQVKEDNKAVEYWVRKFSKSFGRRGMAGRLTTLMVEGKPEIYVAMNPFSSTIVYDWDQEGLNKKTNLNNFVVDTDAAGNAKLVSNYGEGVITYQGQATYLSSGSTDVPYPLPGEFLAACILEWDKADPEHTIVAVVEQGGVVKAYRGGHDLLAKTNDPKGDALDCRRAATGDLFVAVSSTSSDKDRATLLKLAKSNDKYFFEQKWVSQPLDGALLGLKFYDLNGSGTPELIGALETPGGKTRLFYTALEY